MESKYDNLIQTLLHDHSDGFFPVADKETREAMIKHALENNKKVFVFTACKKRLLEWRRYSMNYETMIHGNYYSFISYSNTKEDGSLYNDALNYDVIIFDQIFSSIGYKRRKAIGQLKENLSKKDNKPLFYVFTDPSERYYPSNMKT